MEASDYAIDRTDVEEIVRDMIAERGARSGGGYDDNKPEMLTSLRPFKAFNSSAKEIEVIGVGYFNEMLQFLIIEEDGGAIWPIFREHVFKDSKSAQGAITDAQDAAP